MDLDILKIGVDPVLHFEAVARLRSLKMAASELRLSQPAITHSLNKLETNLGVRLCIRSRAQFALTESGKRLFSVSQEIKSGLQKFQHYLADNEEFDGIFSVGILGNIFNSRFERILERTIREFPSMRLNIQANTADNIQDLVACGELDVGIGLFKGRDTLSYSQIGEEKICHYISDSHPLWEKSRITMSDLHGRHLTWLDIVGRTRMALEAEIFAGQKKAPMKIGSYANSLDAAAFILQSGMSIVPFPAEYLESRVLPFRYRRLDQVLKPYVLKQSIVSRTDFANASSATKFFLEQVLKTN